MRDIQVRHGLIERHAEACFRQRPQIDLFGPSGVDDPWQHVLRHLDGDGVKELPVREAEAEFLQAFGECRRVCVNAPGNAAQALRPVVHRVHRGHDCQQHLCGAHVARRLFSTDMLFARLQGHAQARAAGPVLGDADDAPRQVALVLVAGRKEGGMGAAVAKWDTEALGVAHGDVRPPFAGRREQGQREQIGGRSDEGSGRMRGLAHRAAVADRAVGRGILQQRADHVALFEIELRGIGHDDLESAGGGACAHDRNRLWMTIRIHEIRQLALMLRHRLGEMHRLGGRGPFVEQRRVGDLESGEIRDHRLEVEQRFEPALRDLRLIRRVCGVPTRVFQHVPQNHRRREAVVIAHAEVGPEDLVLGCKQAQPLERLLFRDRFGNAQRTPQPDVGRHDGVDELVERVVAERAEHRGLLLGGGADVSFLKQIVVDGHLTKVCVIPRATKWSRRRDCPRVA